MTDTRLPRTPSQLDDPDQLDTPDDNAVCAQVVPLGSVQGVHDTLSHGGSGSSDTHLDETIFAEMLSDDTAHEISQVLVVSSLKVIGNTERRYNTDTTTADLDLWGPSPNELLSTNVRFPFVDSALQDPQIAAKMSQLQVPTDYIHALFNILHRRNYVNLQEVLGIRLSEGLIGHLCIIILIMRYHGIKVVDLDLQFCNGFDRYWTDSEGKKTSYVDLLILMLNVHIEWPMRIIAYKYETTLDGTRVIYPDGSEWRAHFLFDRIRVYTKEGIQPSDLEKDLPQVTFLAKNIAQSCSDDPELGGSALDSIANCLAAIGMACDVLRLKESEQGVPWNQARELVTNRFQEEGSSTELRYMSSTYFTSRVSKVVGEIAMHTLSKRGEYWNSHVELKPLFTAVITGTDQIQELVEKSVRAAVLGQHECLQSCLSIIPTFMSLDRNHPKSNNWAFLKFSRNIPTMQVALVRSNSRNEDCLLLQRYRASLSNVSAYEEPEISSYHLGPPSDMFDEVSDTVDIIIGSHEIQAEKGQGVSIASEISCMFTVRSGGAAIGKLVVQDGNLRYEVGNRWRRAAAKLKRLKMLAVGPSGVKAELFRAEEVLNGSAEGVCRALAAGSFGTGAAVWMLAQMTQGSVRLCRPIPVYLQGLAKESDSGIIAAPYLGTSVLNELEFLTDGERLCINVETTNKVLLLSEGQSIYEMSCKSCVLPDAVWRRCVVKGLKPLGGIL